MNSIVVAIVSFAVIFSSALGGIALRRHLPGHHLKDDTKDIVKLGIGVIATMTALVLGLLVSSAKASFDQTSSELTLVAVRMIELDRALARYGPETAEVRRALHRNFSATVDVLYSGDRARIAELESREATARSERVPAVLRDLTPATDVQREARAQAEDLVNQLLHLRWLLLMQEGSTVPAPLLIVVVTWLALIFAGFGVFSPANGTVIGALLLCALCVSGALLMILEMDAPLTGLIRVSDAPLHAALGYLGR